MLWLKRHPIVTTVLIINILLVVVLIIVIIFNNIKTAFLDVFVTPSDAKIIMNGKEINNFETQKTTPGQYTVEISKEGLETKTITLDLKEKETTKLHTYLSGPNNTFDYYIAHYNDLELLKQINENDADINAFLKTYTQKTSLKNKLPLYKTEYSGQELTQDIKIAQSDVVECPKYLCLKITSIFNVYQSTVDQIIKDAGYSPQDYQYEYKIYNK